MTTTARVLEDEWRPPPTLFEGYALDLDGTVYLDDQLLPGAAETVERLRALGAGVVFVTNKPLESAEAYAAKLTGLGIPATAEDIVTALDSLVRYLSLEHPGARLLTIAEPLVDDVCVRAGFEIVVDPEAAEVVVVSFDRGFTYAKLLAAYRAVRRGAVIVATNPDPFCPTEDGGLPDCAAMLAAVEACTGQRAEAVTGKPSRHMGATLVERLGVSPDRAAVVGDRLATDVAMGQSLGMAGILVLSGVTTMTDLAAAERRPDFVIADLAQLLPDPCRGIRMINFVFMLTHSDSTIPGAIDYVEPLAATGLRYIGFKDVGADPEAQGQIAKAARNAGLETMLEVVSVSREDEVRSVRAAVAAGVDWVLGGTNPDAVLPLLDGTGIKYCPFPGRVVGHPSVLEGEIDEIAASAAALTARPGVHGLDLLAYRHATADIARLTRAVVDASHRPVIAAGSVTSAAQIHTLAGAGAWGFTIGSAIFDGLLPGAPDIATQVREVLAIAADA